MPRDRVRPSRSTGRTGRTFAGVTRRYYPAALAVTFGIGGFLANGIGTSAIAQSSSTVAFSVRGKNHISSGTPKIVKYQDTLTNVGAGWNGATTFTAPGDGTYFFSIDFVKDAYLFGGTEEDVFVVLQTQAPGAPEPTDVVNAWAGQGGGKRGTGAVSVVLQLAEGTVVRTRAGSDPVPNGFKRHIPQIHFTGFLIE